MSAEDIEDAIRGLEYFAKKGVGYDMPRHVRVLLEYVTDLEEEIGYLRAEAREKKAWEGRYWALLEEVEDSRHREIDGGDASRGVTDMTVALDVNRYPWLCDEGGWWRLVKDVAQGKRSELHPILAPYTLISARKWEKWT